MTKESWDIPPHKPNEEAEAKKYTGAATKILRGEQQPPFGKGTAGVVMHEKVTVLRGDKAREKELVTKYFSRRAGPDSLEASLAAYQLLKKAGVKHIPTTYRQVGPTEALMTDYTRGGRVAVDGNPNEKTKGLRIISLGNLSELLAAIGDDLKRAMRAKIYITSDSYFFIVPASGGDVDVDFVIGDFGGSGREGKSYSGMEWYKRNPESVQYALFNFIARYVTEDRQKEYRQRIQEWTTALEKEESLFVPANSAMDRGTI